ncbi:MAG: ABC transporter permease [Promethearchaeota archaeon]
MQEIELLITFAGWLLKATLMMSTPLVLAALGGLFSEKTGVVNIGLEGMMLIGAFSAVAATYFTNNPWLGVLAAVISGGMLAAVHAIVCVKYKGNQIVSGAGIILFAGGFTTLMLEVVWGVKGVSDSVTKLPNVVIEPIRDIPILGRALGAQSPLVYIMIILVIVSWYVLYKTPFGLRVQAAGEDPSALDAAGVNVSAIRMIGVILSGCLSGLGGAFLSISLASEFGKLMTVGRGFIALAALIFGNWTPFGCLMAGVLFGFLDGLQLAITVLPEFDFMLEYVNFIKMIPYILVIVALAGIRRSVPPKAVGTPYEKEARG